MNYLQKGNFIEKNILKLYLNLYKKLMEVKKIIQNKIKKKSLKSR